MIVSTVNVHEFIQQFKDRGRDSQFSREGLQALFQYLEDYSEDTGEDFQLDVTELCCDYTEYSSFEDVQQDYICCESLEDLQDHTHVIMLSGSGMLVSNY